MHAPERKTIASYATTKPAYYRYYLSRRELQQVKAEYNAKDEDTPNLNWNHLIDKQTHGHNCTENNDTGFTGCTTTAVARRQWEDLQKTWC